MQRLQRWRRTRGTNIPHYFASGLSEAAMDPRREPVPEAEAFGASKEPCRELNSLGASDPRRELDMVEPRRFPKTPVLDA